MLRMRLARSRNAGRVVSLLGALAVGTVGAVAVPARVATATPIPSLQLVAVRDQLPGAFTGPHVVWADQRNVYLAGMAAGNYPGGMFVLARNESDRYPLRQAVQMPGAYPTAVVGDEHGVYTTWSDAHLRTYRFHGNRLALARDVALASPVYPTDLAVSGATLFIAQAGTVATSQGLLAANTLSDSDLISAYGTDGTPGMTWSNLPFGTTSFFDVATGALLGEIANPPNLFGDASATRLFGDSSGFRMTGGDGCCGSGFQHVVVPSLTVDPFVSAWFTNAAVSSGLDVVVGTELGTVLRYDSSNTLVASVDLRAATGHTGSEDIEIRSVFVEGGFVFAASSWGNDVSRSPALPNFFVLRLPDQTGRKPS